MWLRRQSESNASSVSTRRSRTKRSCDGHSSPLPRRFKRWEREELDSGELSEIIHKFHQGPARDLWVRYNTAHLEMAVAFAITTGLLSRDTIPTELLDHLAGPLRFYAEEQPTS